MNCTNCNTENQETSKFCINCGQQFEVETGKRKLPDQNQNQNKGSTEVTQLVEGKNPIVACVLSLLIVGLGQFYNGDTKKGLLLLAGAMVLGTLTAGVVWLALGVYSAYDAYQVADGKKRLEAW